MKDTLKRYECFCLYDSEGIQDHLTRMAQRGWRLESITRLCWQYRRSRPEGLRYAVSYLADVSHLDPRPGEGQEVFWDYCRRAGWVLVTQWDQMQILATDRADAPPLESDERVKLQATHRAIKKGLLRNALAGLALVAIQVFSQVESLGKGMVETLTLGAAPPMLAAWVLFGVGALLEGGCYLWWYFRAKAALNQGKGCPQVGFLARRSGVIRLGLNGMAVVLGLWGILTSSLGWVGLPLLALIVGVVGLICATSRGLKTLGEPKKVNLAATMTVGVAAMLIMFPLLAQVATSSLWDRPPDDIYEILQPSGEVRQWKVFLDALPLRLEDLGVVKEVPYSYEWSRKGSPFLTQYSATQRPAPGETGAAELYYRILEVRWPVFLEACWEDCVRPPEWEQDWPMEQRWNYRPVEEPAWGADRVWRRFTGEEAESKYLLCWGNRIVYLTLEAPPTEAQMEVIREKLTGELP